MALVRHCVPIGLAANIAYTYRGSVARFVAGSCSLSLIYIRNALAPFRRVYIPTTTSPTSRMLSSLSGLVFSIAATASNSTSRML